ncbi:hypothetical protein SNS2_4514 [Streptomyces netropsis]|nr:hypothetical protein SNS2_4514 [Streptomyces netropsis]
MALTAGAGTAGADETGDLAPDTDVSVSTRGHKAICMKVVSGNLPEGHRYKLRGCVVKGSERQCTPWHAVRA